MYHKCYNFIHMGVNSLWKCSPVVAGHRTRSARVCVCVSVERQMKHRQGRASKESDSWPARESRPTTVAWLLLALCVDICSDILDPTFQGPIMWGTVTWKLVCTQCCAEFQGRCKPLAPNPLLNQSWLRNLHTPSHPSALRMLQHSQRCGQNNALVTLPLVLRRKWAERKRFVQRSGQRGGSITIMRFSTLPRKENTNWHFIL